MPIFFVVCSTTSAGRTGTVSVATAAAVASILPSTITATVPSRVPAEIGACGSSGNGVSLICVVGTSRCLEMTINVMSEQLTFTGADALGMSIVPTGSPACSTVSGAKSLNP